MDLKSLFAGLLSRVQRMPPPPPPPGFYLTGPAVDPPEPIVDIPDDAPRAVVGGVYAITYRDSSGRLSKRTITVHEFIGLGDDVLIAAYCQLRAAKRQFYASRILEFTDLQTGEVIDEPEDILWLFRPDDTSVALRNHGGSLALLVAIGRVDGRLAAKERAVVAEWLVSRAGPGVLDLGRIDRHIARLRPDVETLDLAIESLAAAPREEIAEILKAAERVARADGKVVAEEVAFIRDMNRQLGLAG
ncbi:TerB family tellurite resistance protein [Oceanibacterium hippocampi]|uniref:Tellurite resistance protein TerB n=1 Tax=Oceanibacterium hippocampi TaxID=745714 RepID=A0A1Y5TZS9_9PROT|nr:TerB family tellurite resistance protein [Oceanibacterium hippocampi]SLN77528.1 Tellurite resistance protein TerB [Oceanibacterium hippocampi]